MATLNLVTQIAKPCFELSLSAVNPSKLVRDAITFQEDILSFSAGTTKRHFQTSAISRLLIIGAGKAARQMCLGLLEALGNRFPVSGWLNVPYEQKLPLKEHQNIILHGCSHPIPDDAGLFGTRQIINQIEESKSGTLVIALFSGGASSLLPGPAEGLALEDEQNVGSALLASGADIHEINVVRKHISLVKGGRLAKMVTDKNLPLVSLIISDVVGDDIASIASGPTAPDESTFQMASDILRKYNLWDQIPIMVRNRIESGISGRIPPNPNSASPVFSNVSNLLIGSSKTCVEAMRRFLETQSFEVTSLPEPMTGEARDFGTSLVDKIEEWLGRVGLGSYQGAIIGTGELTVTIRGKGIGGRNQEMLLSFLVHLLDRQIGRLRSCEFVVFSAALDGIEGNSPATGAYVHSSMIESAKHLGIDLRSTLDANDSYRVFKALGSALEIGQTGTNVNDIIFVLVRKN